MDITLPDEATAFMDPAAEVALADCAIRYAVELADEAGRLEEGIRATGLAPVVTATFVLRADQTMRMGLAKRPSLVGAIGAAALPVLGVVAGVCVASLSQWWGIAAGIPSLLAIAVLGTYQYVHER